MSDSDGNCRTRRRTPEVDARSQGLRLWRGSARFLPAEAGEEGDGATLVGYYSLSSGSVLLDSLPDGVLEKLARQPSVPVTLMGRLAVRTSDQGTGVGGRLLWNALSRSEALSRAIGSVAVIVDAKDEHVAKYYQSHGLRPFAGQPSRLFITMATIAAARS